MNQAPALYIISDFPDSDDTQRYVEVARTFNVPVRQISHKETPRITKDDAVILRGSPRQSDAVVASLRHIESVGAVCLTTVEGWLASKDRLEMYTKFAAAGVATPYTAESVDAYLTDRSVPAVIKISDSNQGKGVAVADTERSLVSFCDVLDATGRKYVIQEFLPSDMAQDDRYFVVGDEVVAAMRRTAKAGEFRSNLSLGGSAQSIEHDSEAASLAVRAARSLNLRIAGVDIMTTKNGPSVLEVNSSPGLGIEKVTGKEVAKSVIEEVIRLWEK